MAKLKKRKVYFATLVRGKNYVLMGTRIGNLNLVHGVKQEITAAEYLNLKRQAVDNVTQENGDDVDSHQVAKIKFDVRVALNAPPFDPDARRRTGTVAKEFNVDADDEDDDDSDEEDEDSDEDEEEEEEDGESPKLRAAREKFLKSKAKSKSAVKKDKGKIKKKTR